MLVLTRFMTLDVAKASPVVVVEAVRLEEFISSPGASHSSSFESSEQVSATFIMLVLSSLSTVVEAVASPVTISPPIRPPVPSVEVAMVLFNSSGKGSSAGGGGGNRSQESPFQVPPSVKHCTSAQGSVSCSPGTFAHTSTSTGSGTSSARTTTDPTPAP